MAGFTRVSMLKVLELLLACVCIGLHYHSFVANDMHGHLVMSATYGGFIIILAGLFTGMLTGQPIPKRVDMFYSLAGVALFTTSGVLTIEYMNNASWTIGKETRDIGLAKGSISIINAVVFLFDLIFTFRD